MGNPARELHDIYAAWRAAVGPSGQSALVAAVDVRAEAPMREVVRAYGLIAQIESTLRRLAADRLPVGVFQRQLLVWARVPLAINVTWKSAAVQQDAFVPMSVLNEIEMCALFLDGKVHEFDSDRQADLTSVLAQAHAVLRDDDSLPTELRQYLHQLIREIQIALGDEEFGRTFDFAEAVRRLWVALRAAEGASADDDRRSRWRALADAIAVGTVSGGAIEAGKAVIQLFLES